MKVKLKFEVTVELIELTTADEKRIRHYATEILSKLESPLIDCKVIEEWDVKLIEVKQELKEQTIVCFKMTPNSKEEEVKFNSSSTPKEVSQYFEDSCGGVYEWWYKDEQKSEEKSICDHS